MAARTIAYLKALWVTNYQPTQADFADLFDTLHAGVPDLTWQVADAPTGTQKPSGNTLADAALAGALPRDILYIDNVPLQWKAAGVTFSPATGTFDFTAAIAGGGNYLQNNSYITIQFQ